MKQTNIQNPELEAAIIANPEDLETWAVYGDWLQSRDDPRGEVVALELAQAKGGNDKKRAVMLHWILAKYWDDWLPKELSALLSSPMAESVRLKLVWRYGFFHSARVSTNRSYYGGALPHDLLQSVLKSPSSLFLHELIVGITDDGDFSGCITAIAEAGERPSIRSLHLGDFTHNECTLDDTSIGPVERVLPALPNLEWLKIRGNKIEFQSLEHQKLKTLILETDVLTTNCLRIIAGGSLPALEYLELWTGESDDESKDDSKVQDLEALFSGKGFPVLKHLGLKNCAYTTKLVVKILKAPLLRHLNSLDLSGGTLTAKGTAALLAGAEALQHLKRIDVTDNVISPDNEKELKAAFGDKIHIGSQWKYEMEQTFFPGVDEE